MEELLKTLGIDEAASEQILSKYNDDVSAAGNVAESDIANLKAEIEEYKNSIAEKDTVYGELEGKYNDTAAKLKGAGYREFLFGSGVKKRSLIRTVIKWVISVRDLFE